MQPNLYKFLATAVVTASLTALPPAAALAAACEGPSSVDPARELLINAPTVMQDARANPGGPWHFATLVRAMAPVSATDKDVSDMVLAWLSTWDHDQTLTPDPALPELPANPARLLRQRPDVASLRTAWLAASVAARAASGQPEDGTLKLDLAPFALRAIVYRPDRRDLRQCASSAGEGRFVFGALAQPTAQPTAAAPIVEMTVIFEYDLPPAAATARGWAQMWHALGNEPCSADACEGYKAKLTALTDAFSQRSRYPGRPAGNALAQLRTNELIDFPSELRQFKLVAAAGGRNALANVPIEQTPDWSLNAGLPLGQWAAANQAAILAEKHVVPPQLIGFTGPSPRAAKWRLANVTALPADQLEALRFKLSKNTCNGCHSFEHPAIFNVDGTWHISPEGRVSRFLTTAELPARQAEVCQLLNQDTCTDATSGPAFKPARGH